MTVYSFYSYKGGVGRSMALANVAVLFHRRPLDVIVVDWDLEAPGIERYFAERYPGARSSAVLGAPGLCDLIESYRRNVATPPEPGAPVPSPYPSVDRHLVTLGEIDGCRLRLMTAGARRDWAAYAGFVQSFDWTDFYENWAGGGFFDWLRDELMARADIVLIDARTGITEMGGVATRHMADGVVVVFAGNEENMESSARMARTFLAPRDDGRAVSVILVPSRIDDSDSGEYRGFLARLADISADLAATVAPDGWQMLELLLPYHARLAFREQLVVGNGDLESVLGPLAEGYRRIAAQMQRSAPVGSRLSFGSGVARGRVYLVEETALYRVGDLVRQFLEANGYDVVPPPNRVAVGEVDETELAGAGCVVALIDERSMHSKALTYVLNHASRLGKLMIPVLLGQVGRLPFVLADIAPLRWDPSSPATSLEALARGIAAPQGPDTGEHAAVFLSYGRADETTARTLAGGLQARGIPTWLDVVEVPVGARFVEAQQEALDHAGTVVVLCSTALNESRQAQQEVIYAERNEKLIVPVRLEDVPIPALLSSTVAVDARNQPLDATIDAIADVVRPVSGAVTRSAGDRRAPRA